MSKQLQVTGFLALMLVNAPTFASVEGGKLYAGNALNHKLNKVEVSFEIGAKLVNKAVKGVGTSEFDVRPYIEVGAYRQQTPMLKLGTAVNFAPNILASDTPALLNFKVLDVHYQFSGEHVFSAYGGALRQARKYTAWGYSIGVGYGTSMWGYQVKTNLSWARTNTDIGGLAAETGAKDNIVWINIGVRF